MKTLNVSIEINGKQVHAGTLTGSSIADTVFNYADSYIEAGYKPISISLPTKNGQFSPEATKNYFEGLLPEGFARQSVARWIHAQEDDYLTILEALGSECLGAIRISRCNEEQSTSNQSVDNQAANQQSYNENASYEALTMEEVKALAREGVTKSTELVTGTHLSLTGASGKVGLYYDESTGTWFKPMGNAPSTHIVKQSHVRLANIVTNEQLCLMTAAKLGLDVPKSFIINTGGTDDESILFATRRYDRPITENSTHVGNLSRPFRLHQEDFAQALGIAAKDKYEVSEGHYLRRIFEIVRSNVRDPIKDQIKLWNILIFDYLIGNTDNHIKNISLLYSEDLRRVSLAPAYDIISTSIYPESSKEMAIGIGTEHNIKKVGREQFADAAQEAGLSTRLALNHLDDMGQKFEASLSEAAFELSNQGYTNALRIRDAILRTGGYANL